MCPFEIVRFGQNEGGWKIEERKCEFFLLFNLVEMRDGTKWDG